MWLPLALAQVQVLVPARVRHAGRGLGLQLSERRKMRQVLWSWWQDLWLLRRWVCVGAQTGAALAVWGQAGRPRLAPLAMKWQPKWVALCQSQRLLVKATVRVWRGRWLRDQRLLPGSVGDRL